MKTRAGTTMAGTKLKKFRWKLLKQFYPRISGTVPCLNNPLGWTLLSCYTFGVISSDAPVFTSLVQHKTTWRNPLLPGASGTHIRAERVGKASRRRAEAEKIAKAKAGMLKRQAFSVLLLGSTLRIENTTQLLEHSTWIEYTHLV